MCARARARVCVRARMGGGPKAQSTLHLHAAINVRYVSVALCYVPPTTSGTRLGWAGSKVVVWSNPAAPWWCQTPGAVEERGASHMIPPSPSNTTMAFSHSTPAYNSHTATHTANYTRHGMQHAALMPWWWWWWWCYIPAAPWLRRTPFPGTLPCWRAGLPAGILLGCGGGVSGAASCHAGVKS